MGGICQAQQAPQLWQSWPSAAKTQAAARKSTKTNRATPGGGASDAVIELNRHPSGPSGIRWNVYMHMLGAAVCRRWQMSAS